MSLLTKLQEDMKTALKAGQKDRLSVLRMLISEVKNIDLSPQKPTEEEAVAAYAKKLRKSLEEYERLGKPDEVAKLKGELEVAENYLPKKVSAEETDRLADEFLSQNSFTEKQFGQAMGAFMKANAGKVDAALASSSLKKRLSGK
jgi:uncharacterized protein